MGKFHQLLTELSARHPSVFSLPGDNLSKFALNGCFVFENMACNMLQYLMNDISAEIILFHMHKVYI